MNILIGNEGNKIVVISDPHVLANYKIEAGRYMKMVDNRQINQYYIVISLGDISVCSMSLYNISFNRQDNIGYYWESDRFVKHNDSILRLEKTGFYLHLSQDAIDEFDKKIAGLKQVYERDLVISQRFCECISLTTG